MSTQLLEPILTGGIRNTNFFNGRLLTAEALSAEQTANRQQHQQLGQAIGSGLVRGLEVNLLNAGPQPVVQVKAGLALNRLGQALALPQDVEVALTADLPHPTPAAGLFAPCAPPHTVPVGSQAGVYMLVMAPASRYSTERAPLHGFADNGRINGCGQRDTIEGVQFRLVFVDTTAATLMGAAASQAVTALMGNNDPAALSHLRNLLAYACLGTPEASHIPATLYRYLKADAEQPQYGLLDRLTAAGTLTACDMPLALLYWTGSGVQFVDRWSVCRRLTPHTALLNGLLNQRRQTEGEAAFLQFQAHIAHLSRASIPQAQLTPLQAANYFRYLPAAGIIPLARTSTDRGFNADNFFSGLISRAAVTIEGDKVRPFLEKAFLYDPIDLDDAEFLWLYTIRDNQQPLAENPAATTTAYLLFTSGHLPYAGTPLFDQARWDYSHYNE